MVYFTLVPKKTAGRKVHLEFDFTEAFKVQIKRRPIIEHKNAELKRYLGLTRAKYRGLFRMRIQTFLNRSRFPKTNPLFHPLLPHDSPNSPGRSD
jgi:hypothetical protein